MADNEAAQEAAMQADMDKRRADEAAIAKVQDAALAAVKAACNAERAKASVYA